jgi:hypothetical protein
MYRFAYGAILFLCIACLSSAELTKPKVLDLFQAGVAARIDSVSATLAEKHADAAKALKIPARRNLLLSFFQDVIAADPRSSYPATEPDRLLADAEAWTRIYAGAMVGTEDMVKQQIATIRSSILENIKSGGRVKPRGPAIVEAGTKIIERANIEIQKQLADVHLDAPWGAMPDHLKGRMKSFAGPGFNPDTELIHRQLMNTYLADCIVVEGERAKAALKTYLLNYFLADVGASRAPQIPELSDEALKLLVTNQLGIRPANRTPEGKLIVQLSDFQAQLGQLYEKLNEASVSK